MLKCCCCISLTKGVRLIGLALFLVTLGVFVGYLVFIEEFRRNVLQNFYEIVACDQPNIDRLIDTSFEYSMLCNVLLIIMCTNGSCNTRWLLMPWMVVYAIDIILLVCLSVFLFIYPLPLLPEHRPEFPALRCFGLVPLALACLLAYCWYVVRSMFNKMSSEHIAELTKRTGNPTGSNAGMFTGAGAATDSHTMLQQADNESCCSMQLKTGVQIITGFIGIMSALVLVAYYAKFDVRLDDKYHQLFRTKPTQAFQVTNY